MQLRGGKRHHLKLDEVYGAPGRPMSRESQLEKFRANAAAAIRPMPGAQVEALIGRLSALRDVGDVREIARLLVVS
jgi:hypothetical protein